jgi:hypothetical protein
LACTQPAKSAVQPTPYTDTYQNRRWLPEEPMLQDLARLHGVNVNREYAEVFQVYSVVV